MAGSGECPCFKLAIGSVGDGVAASTTSASTNGAVAIAVRSNGGRAKDWGRSGKSNDRPEVDFLATGEV